MAAAEAVQDAQGKMASFNPLAMFARQPSSKWMTACNEAEQEAALKFLAPDDGRTPFMW